LRLAFVISRPQDGYRVFLQADGASNRLADAPKQRILLGSCIAPPFQRIVNGSAKRVPTADETVCLRKISAERAGM
jgi:hypothetical protein